ncbi:hypothetical protein Vadar_017129 [Vaccinium darrowii]|uniref:Uncharacterized protein n=1 Tax=Vaccinium darrowii TaxID=229202 RepID=A0ACB7Y7B2_9ERIC|nr:hypothetical protein Vadar_017129 [Vaccinium darrowii]
MAPRKQRTMEDIYETDNTKMQQQISAMAEQIAALTLAFQQQQPPLNAHFMKEEEEEGQTDEEENPFARDHPRRRDTRPADAGFHRQGAKTVEEYTTEFYQLLARNDLGETEEQLVSRYIGGLQATYQDTLNLFDPYSISEAYQKALQAEKQAKRRSSNSAWASGSSRNTTQPGVNRGTMQIGNSPAVPQNRIPITTGGSHCFKCGEPGHRMADCKKTSPSGKGLFIEGEEIVGDEVDVPQQDPVYDSTND